MAKRKGTNHRRGPGRLNEDIRTDRQVRQDNKDKTKEIVRLGQKIKYLERQVNLARRDVARLRRIKFNPEAFMTFAHATWDIVKMRGLDKRAPWPVFYIWATLNDKGESPKMTANRFAVQVGKGLEEYEAKVDEATVALEAKETLGAGGESDGK